MTDRAPPSAAALLKHTDHRPWPLPGGRWVMRQSWLDLLFVHWPVEPAALRPLVPAALELDLHDGAAWVGIVPFRAHGTRLRGLPPVPGAAAFPELNLRTYVRHGGRPGVWFFSLDAASRLAVRAARAWFGLPYFDAEMAAAERDGWIDYTSRRTHRGAPPAELCARYRPMGPAERAAPGSLDAFLVERYCLYALRRGALVRGEIHHPPWPLQPAELELDRESLAAASGIALPARAPLLHFARRLDVLFWPPRPLA
jgi:uncharacterized protein YqjF (DUF2071 family)